MGSKHHSRSCGDLQQGSCTASHRSLLHSLQETDKQACLQVLQSMEVKSPTWHFLRGPSCKFRKLAELIRRYGYCERKLTDKFKLWSNGVDLFSLPSSDMSSDVFKFN